MLDLSGEWFADTCQKPAEKVYGWTFSRLLVIGDPDESGAAACSQGAHSLLANVLGVHYGPILRLVQLTGQHHQEQYQEVTDAKLPASAAIQKRCIIRIRRRE